MYIRISWETCLLEQLQTDFNKPKAIVRNRMIESKVIIDFENVGLCFI